MVLQYLEPTLHKLVVAMSEKPRTSFQVVRKTFDKMVCIEIVNRSLRHINHSIHVGSLFANAAFAAGMWHYNVKGEISPNNNVDSVSRKQFYKPNSKILSKFG